MRTTLAAYRGTQAHAAPFHVMAKPIGPICNLDCKQVRTSLLVDPKELRKSDVVRTETAKAAAAIAEHMAGYMAGYSISAPEPVEVA
ncbi:MAG TPA: hypothetical protein VM912_18370 [Terriglobales bacterium]|nr:hypothetical protein [Terriglobales bacterium]